MSNSDGGKGGIVRCMDNSGQWFQRSLGQEVLHAELFCICKVLPDLFGYHILQIGSPGGAQYLDCSRIKHKVNIGSSRVQPTGGAHVICDQHALPVGSDSVDVMVLPHVLEFDTHPHQVLREMERVLIGDGHVVIIGFNPWSLWGLWRLFNAWRDRYPWNGKYIRMARLRDWLDLLDFEITRIEYFYYRPPVENVHISRKLGFLEQLGRFSWRYFGGIYMVVAKKRVIPMTPVKVQWQMRRHMLTPGVAEPSARNKF